MGGQILRYCLVLVIILLVGCSDAEQNFSVPYTGEAHKKVDLNEIISENIREANELSQTSDPPHVDLDYLREAQETDNMGACLKIESTGLKNSCEDTLNYAEAIQKNEISFCNKIHDKSNKKQCKEYVTSQKGKAAKDSNICNGLEDPTLCNDNVNYESAISKMDISFCNNILDIDKRNACTSEVVPFAAVINENIGLCRELGDDKKICEDYYYYAKAVIDLKSPEGGTKELCGKVRNATLRESCKGDTRFSKRRLVSIHFIMQSNKGNFGITRINTSKGPFTLLRYN